MIVASVGDGGQPGADRFAAGRTAGHGTLANGVVGGDHDHDTVARRLGNGAGVIDHATFTEALVLFQGPEPLAAAAADHDRPDVLSAGHNRAG